MAHRACALEDSGILLTDFAGANPSVDHRWIFEVRARAQIPPFLSNFLARINVFVTMDEEFGEHVEFFSFVVAMVDIIYVWSWKADVHERKTMEISHIYCNVAKDERMCGVMDAHFATKQADWSSDAFLDCKIFQRDNGPTEYLLGQVRRHFWGSGPRDVVQVAEEDLLRAGANVLFSLDCDLTFFTAFRWAALLADSDMMADGNTRFTFVGKSIGGGGVEDSDGHDVKDYKPMVQAWLAVPKVVKSLPSPWM